jgi:hypothetical protein
MAADISYTITTTDPLGVTHVYTTPENPGHTFSFNDVNGYSLSLLMPFRSTHEITVTSTHDKHVIDWFDPSPTRGVPPESGSFFSHTVDMEGKEILISFTELKLKDDSWLFPAFVATFMGLALLILLLLLLWRRPRVLGTVTVDGVGVVNATIEYTLTKKDDGELIRAGTVKTKGEEIGNYLIIVEMGAIFKITAITTEDGKTGFQPVPTEFEIERRETELHFVMK